MIFAEPDVPHCVQRPSSADCTASVKLCLLGYISVSRTLPADESMGDVAMKGCILCSANKCTTAQNEATHHWQCLQDDQAKSRNPEKSGAQIYHDDFLLCDWRL
jgi:hypothetical protein